MSFLRVKQAASILGVSSFTVRRWCGEGKLDYTLSAAGQRIFDEEYLKQFMAEVRGENVKERTTKIVFYIRSSNGNDVTMETQENLLTEEYGIPHHIYKDKASGLNEQRKYLRKMIQDAKNKEFTHIAVTSKDRLTRFGFSYLEELFSAYGIDIIVLDSTQETKEPHEVLMQDFMSLIASFSGKFYRLRGYNNQKKLLKKAGEKIDEKQQ